MSEKTARKLRKAAPEYEPQLNPSPYAKDRRQRRWERFGGKNRLFTKKGYRNGVKMKKSTKLKTKKKNNAKKSPRRNSRNQS